RRVMVIAGSVLEVPMLAPPPPAAADEPEVVSVTYCHFLAGKNVPCGYSHDSEFFSGLHLMETGSRVARVVQKAYFAAGVENVDADMFVTGSLCLHAQRPKKIAELQFGKNL
ncbi:hypothetical protein L914_14463, partial [Phytophthora nicotianae]